MKPTAVIECRDAIAFLEAQPADSASMLFSSPPYIDCRTYGIGAQRDCLEWLSWMLKVCVAAQRVVTGPMFWVVAGATRERNYWPACEGLAYEWWKMGGTYQLYRPCVFDRVGIPGSGGDDYLRSDWEYVLCMKRPGKLPYFDLQACGHPPKWAPGGEMSHRLKNGERVNQWGMRVKEDGTLTATEPTKDGSVSQDAKPSHEVVTVGEEEPSADLFGDERTPVEAGNQWGNVGSEKGMGGRNANGSTKKKGRPSHKLTNGGSKRNADGSKVAIARRSPVGHDSDGDVIHEDAYTPPVLANPGTTLETKYTHDDVLAILAAHGVKLEPSSMRTGNVGGGLMGNKIASLNEAPFPEWLAKFFVTTFCPPGEKVLDCFGGSFTTAAVAVANGRNFVGCDIRQEMVDIGLRRVAGESCDLFAMQE